MASFFRKAETEKQFRKWYWKQLDELGRPYEVVKVETSFGNTQVVELGQAGAPPVLLLHAENSCAPIALTACVGLLDRFRVHAVDIIGEPNLSAPVRPALSNDAYGQWMYELQSRLGLRGAQGVGISFGAAILMKSLVFNPNAFKALHLISPLAWVDPSNPPEAIPALRALESFEQSGYPSFRELYIREVLTDTEGLEAQFLRLILGKFQRDQRRIGILTDQQLERIAVPLNLVLAEGDALVPHRVAQQRWKNLFSGTSWIHLLPHSRHIPSAGDFQQIVELIKLSAAP